jgi:NADH-quinone oxidoreductase subunit N
MKWELNQLIPEVFVGLSLSARLILGSVILTGFGKEKAEDLEHRLQWTERRNRSLVRCFGLAGLLVIHSRRERGEESLASSTRLWNGSLVVNFSTQVVKLVLVWSTARVILGSESRRTRLGIRASEYSLRMGFATLGLMVMASANDRVSLYLGLEWQALALYVLASFTRHSAHSTEAGLKYFILGSVMSGVYLFGASLIYGGFGTVNFTERRHLMRTEDQLLGLTGLGLDSSEHPLDGLAVLGLVLVLSTLRFKLAAVPFHMWAPDVYEGSPASSSIYFAVVPKIGILSLRVRLVVSFGEYAMIWQPRLMVISVLCLTLAPFAARLQMKWKRFLAYSSIANVGLILLAVAMNGFAGLQAVWIYALVYVRTVLGVWVSIASVVKRETRGSVRRFRPIQSIHELDGLAQNNPVLAYTIAAGILSSAGLPPFVMFYAKRSVLFAALAQLHRGLSIFVVRISVVTTFYYLRFVKIRFFTKESTGKDVQGALTSGTAVLLGVVRSLLVILLFDSNLRAGVTTWMAIASGA